MNVRPKGRNPSQSRLARACASLVAAALLLGCREDRSPYFGSLDRRAKDPRTFYINNGSEPEYLDPGKSNDSASSTLVMQMFEGLTVYDAKDLHPVQGVATRWDRSEDNRVYSFTLRPDAKWSDGVPVRAHDFEYAWKRVLRPSFASLAASNLYSLKNAEPFHMGKLKVVRSDLDLLREPAPGAPVVRKLSKGSAVRIVASEEGETKPAAPEPPPAFVRVVQHLELPTFGARAPAARAEPAAEGFVPLAELVEDDRLLGVRAVDDLTLEVELERPTPYFLELTSFPTLAPVRRDVVEAFEARGEPDMWTRPGSMVVNGPFMLDEWKFRYEITMKQNPYYWDRARLKLDRIVWFEVEELNATLNLYKAGDLDFIGDNGTVPQEYLDILADKRDFTIAPYLSTYWFEFNTTKPPVDDVRVRRALNLAVDKQLLVEKITRGGQLPATHYVPDYTGSGYAEQAAEDRAAGADPFSSPDARYDPERARALLGEAGYPVVKEADGYRASGFPPLEILYNTSEGHKNIAVALQDMFKRNLGVSVTLRNEEWKVMLKNVRDGHFQMVRFAWVGDYNHPHTWLDTFLSHSPQNHTRLADPEFDELLARAAATSDPRESIRRYREAEKRAVDSMAKLPLYFYTKPSLSKPWVKGLKPNARSTHLIKWFWIDPSWQTNGDDSFAFPGLELGPPGKIGAP